MESIVMQGIATPKPEDTRLTVLVDQSGLETSKAKVILDKFNDFFVMADEWDQKAKALVIRDENDKENMAIAREGRIWLKKRRGAVEATRKELKEESWKEGKAIDSIAKILTELIVPIEDDLEKKERFAEFKAMELFNARLAERIGILSKFPVAMPDQNLLGNMDDAMWNIYLNGIKKQEADRLEAEAKAEKERAEAETREKLRWVRADIMKPYYNYFDDTRGTQLADLSEPDFLDLVETLKAKKEEDEKQQEQIRIENERLKINAEKQERIATEGRRKFEEKLAEEKRKADAKLKKERDDRVAAEAELKRKQDAEAEEKRIARAKERKAKAAPDKEKLLTLANMINVITMPVLHSEEANVIALDAKVLLSKTVKFIREKAEKLGDE